MSNKSENEDKSAPQQVPGPLETDDPIIANANQVPVEQLRHTPPPPTDPNPPAPLPMDENKPILPENWNAPPPTEAAPPHDNAELESTSQHPHQHSPSPPSLPEGESFVKPQIEPSTDEKPVAVVTLDSKSETMPGNWTDMSKSKGFSGNGTDSEIHECETSAGKVTDTEIAKSETSIGNGTKISKSGTVSANETEICKSEASAGNATEISKSEEPIGDGTEISSPQLETSKHVAEAKTEHPEVPDNKSGRDADVVGDELYHPATPVVASSKIKPEVENPRGLNCEKSKMNISTRKSNGNSGSVQSFLLDDRHNGSESGTEEEQLAFMKELDNFFRERSMEFKPPKFYGEGLNCLKLWRAVMRLGGYDKVTSCKLWRQVGESFKPPKTCTTVSWTFRGFYEKALLDYERHKTRGGELATPVASNSEPMHVDNQASGSGRTRRDAAARAMQGWHEQRLLGHGDDKNSVSSQKREKQVKSLGLLKRKKPSYVEDASKVARSKSSKSQLDVDLVDIGPPADWVKINVQRTKDCFEVYALVPGLLREEVRVQSDPAGRLVISGEPEHPDNPWGVTPFKKVVGLPSRIDPHQTSAVVTLHGQLLVRVPFEQSD